MKLPKVDWPDWDLPGFYLSSPLSAGPKQHQHQRQRIATPPPDAFSNLPNDRKQRLFRGCAPCYQAIIFTPGLGTPSMANAWVGTFHSDSIGEPTTTWAVSEGPLSILSQKPLKQQEGRTSHPEAPKTTLP